MRTLTFRCCPSSGALPPSADTVCGVASNDFFTLSRINPNVCSFPKRFYYWRSYEISQEENACIKHQIYLRKRRFSIKQAKFKLTIYEIISLVHLNYKCKHLNAYLFDFPSIKYNLQDTGYSAVKNEIVSFRAQVYLLYKFSVYIEGVFTLSCL